MKHLQKFVLIGTLVSMSAISAHASNDLSFAQVRTQIQNVQEASNAQERGFIGNIIANVFNTSGRITAPFIDSFVGLQNFNIPYWNDGNFVPGAINQTPGINGRVGIGTSPHATARLNVSGASLFTGIISADAGVAANNNLNLGANNNIVFGTNSASRMIINPTGSVGIGTLSPERQLHVNQITNGIVGLRLQSNFASRGIVDFEPRGMGGGRLVLGVGSNESNIGENPFFFTRQGNFGAGVRWGLMGSSDIGVFPSALMGQAESDDAYISSASNNRPSESDVLTLYNHGTQDDIETWAGIYMGTRGGGTLTRRGARIAVVPDMNMTFASDIVFQATRYHDARLYERLRIQGDSGNVGIGTTSPSSRLHVIGDVRVNNILSQDNSGVKGILGGSNAAGGANILLYGSQNNTHPNTISLNAGLSPRLTVHGGSGNVGIGITVPSQRLDVNGNIRANAFLYASDKNLKRDITPYTAGKSVISSIGVKRYNWKDTGKSDIGVIAQDVQKVFPEAVSQGEDGVLSVDYAKLVVPLLQVTQEQEERIQELENIILHMK